MGGLLIIVSDGKVGELASFVYDGKGGLVRVLCPMEGHGLPSFVSDGSEPQVSFWVVGLIPKFWSQFLRLYLTVVGLLQ